MIFWLSKMKKKTRKVQIEKITHLFEKKPSKRYKEEREKTGGQ